MKKPKKPCFKHVWVKLTASDGRSFEQCSKCGAIRESRW